MLGEAHVCSTQASSCTHIRKSTALLISILTSAPKKSLTETPRITSDHSRGAVAQLSGPECQPPQGSQGHFDQDSESPAQTRLHDRSLRCPGIMAFFSSFLGKKCLRFHLGGISAPGLPQPRSWILASQGPCQGPPCLLGGATINPGQTNYIHLKYISAY